MVNPDGVGSIISIKPNPTSNELKLDLQLVEKGITKIFLTDILGNVVKILSDREMQIGNQSLTFFIKDIPSGKYFLILQTPTIFQREAIEVIR